MKRILGFVLLCVMVLTASTASAQDWPVSDAATLKDVFSKANNGDSITLNTDITLDSKLEINIPDKEITIDLNQKTIRSSKKLYCLLRLQGGYLTIKNGTMDGCGSDMVIRVGLATSEISTGVRRKFARLTIENDVLIKNEGDGGFGIVLRGNNELVDDYGLELIFNGTIDLNGDANGICNHGTGGNTPTHIVVNPYSKINVDIAQETNAAGIYHPGSGDLEIYGGEIMGPTAVEMKGGSLCVSGDEFKAKSSRQSQRAYGSGNSTSGYALAFVANSSYSHAGKGIKNKDVKISGGTFEGPIALLDDGTTNQIRTGNGANDIKDRDGSTQYSGGTFIPTITVTGGVFRNEDKSTVEAWINSDYEIREKTDNPGFFSVVSKASGLKNTATSFDVEKKEISYDIPAEQDPVDLFEFLNIYTYETLKSAEVLPVNDKVSVVSNAALKKLPSLKTLDLSGASALEDTTIDLTGVSIDTVVMSDKTNVTVLTLDEKTKVKTIDAEGCESLTTLTLGKSPNIEKINVAGSQVSEINAAGCEKLEVLNVGGTKTLKTLDVTGCVALKELDCSAGSGKGGEGGITTLDLSDCKALTKLDVSGNSLFFLNLNGLNNLTANETKLGGQRLSPARLQPLDTEFNILNLISQLLGSGTTQPSPASILANITKVTEGLSGAQTEANFNKATGIATFDVMPTKSVRYFYDTRGALASMASFIVSVADDDDANESFLMDVQIADGEDYDPNADSNGRGRSGDGDDDGSGGGCDSVRNDELGVRSVLLVLAISLLAFTKLSKKR